MAAQADKTSVYKVCRHFWLITQTYTFICFTGRNFLAIKQKVRVNKQKVLPFLLNNTKVASFLINKQIWRVKPAY